MSSYPFDLCIRIWNHQSLDKHPSIFGLPNNFHTPKSKFDKHHLSHFKVTPLIRPGFGCPCSKFPCIQAWKRSPCCSPGWSDKGACQGHQTAGDCICWPACWWDAQTWKLDGRLLCQVEGNSGAWLPQRRSDHGFAEKNWRSPVLV